MNAWTTRFRVVAWALFALVVFTALAGWAFCDRDPGRLGDVLMWCAIASGIGEGSNIGKRATWKREATALNPDEVGS
jgi:hypothetical protein